MNCLIITNDQASEPDLENFLSNRNVTYHVVTDVFSGFQKVQEQHFDIVIINTDQDGFKIKQTIQLVKSCDPAARIIVQTHNNTRDLESAIRKEQIFYYHIHSFGLDDLTTAIQSAMDQVQV